MNWPDAAIAVGVLLPPLGAAAALGLALWVSRGLVRQLRERAEGCAADAREAEVRAGREFERAESLRAERDDAGAARTKLEAQGVFLRAETADLREKHFRLEGRLQKYFLAGRKEYEARLALQKREAEWLAQKAELRATTAKAEEARATAVLRGDELAAERDRLAAAGRRARRRTAAQRKRADGLQALVDTVHRQDGRVWQVPVPASAPAFVPRGARRFPVVSVFNLKGGVGKTTVAANLAGLYAREGRRVLMVDLDHQRSLSQLLMPLADRERAFEFGRTIQHFFRSEVKDGPALVQTADPVPGLTNAWLVSNADPRAETPGGQSLDDLEMQMQGRWLLTGPHGEDVRFLLRGALQSEAVGQHFDCVLLDCPPRLSTACLNALAASDLVLVPVQPEAVALRSVQHLLRRLKGLRECGALPASTAVAVVANGVPSRAFKPLSAETEMLAAAKRAADKVWGEPVHFLETMLLHHSRYADATRALDSAGALKLAIQYPSVRKVYDALADEIEGLVHANRGVAGLPA